MEHFYGMIQGWFGPDQQSLYKSIVSKLPNDSHIVEIGCWKGRSTSCMGVEIANSGKNIKFDCVDNFMGSLEHQDDPSIIHRTLYQEFLLNIGPVRKYVNPIVEFSVVAARRYEDKSLDFVFIDGEHSYRSVRADILAWLPKLKPGGIIAGDDFIPGEYDGVVTAVREQFQDKFIQQGNIWLYNIDTAENVFKFNTDAGLDLNYNFDRKVDAAYIISLENNETSKIQTNRCIESCVKVGMDYKIFYGYDGTDHTTIKTPTHLLDKDYMRWIKLLDHTLSITEVACALSHIALWAHCIKINKPIVILEHDAIMIKAYNNFKFYNVVEFLGERADSHRLQEMLNVPDELDIIDALKTQYITRDQINAHTWDINVNYLYPRGLPAYAIDPFIAKRMFNKVMTDGLINPVDCMLETSLFPVVQSSVYAFPNKDAVRLTTIETNSTNGNNGRKHYLNIPGVAR
jgi:GR25 family glycosyltransferase involved in LPS biosynthesis/predicted O-methyltransferase YrrM